MEIRELDTKGVFTKYAEPAWKVIVLVAAVAAFGFEVARQTGPAVSEAKAATPPHEAPAPLMPALPSDIAQRLERIEQAQNEMGKVQNKMGIDVAVLLSQVKDLREAKGLPPAIAVPR